MEISFIKKGLNKHVISCKRNDGSVTWMQSDDFFVRHDLMHYAVETTMNYKNGFYGILNSGVNITDFELPKDKRNFEFTPQALYAETLVGLISTELSQGNFENIEETINDMYKANYPGVKAPEINPASIDQIKVRYHELVLDWMKLSPDQKLVLHF